MKFSITDFFSKCDQMQSFLSISTNLLKKSIMENAIALQVYDYDKVRRKFSENEYLWRRINPKLTLSNFV